MKDFIFRNKWALLIATTMFSLYLYITYNGNRICDCQTTEKTQSGTNHAYRGGGVNRFHHK